MCIILNYKGFSSEIRLSEEDNVLFGKITNIKDLVLFEGDTLKEIRKEFRSLVDEILLE